MRKRLISWSLCLVMLLMPISEGHAEKEPGFWENLGRQLDSVGDAVTGAISDGWEAAKEGVMDAADRAGQWVGDTVGSVGDSIGTWLYEGLNGVFQPLGEMTEELFMLVASGAVEDEMGAEAVVMKDYMEAMQHAYAKYYPMFAERAGISLGEKEQAALDGMRAYSAEGDTAFLLSSKTMNEALELLNACAAESGADMTDFDRAVTVDVADALLRKYGAPLVDTLLRYAEEKGVEIESRTRAELYKVRKYAEGQLELSQEQVLDLLQQIGPLLNDERMDTNDLLEMFVESLESE